MENIPKISKKITDKYDIVGNTFIRKKGKALKVIIDKQKIKIDKWNGKINFSARLASDRPIIKTEGDKIKFIDKKKEVHFYEKEHSPLPKNRHGTWEELMKPQTVYEYEQEIILKEKPASNKIILDLEFKNLKYEKEGKGFVFYKEEKDLPEEEVIRHDAFHLEPVKVKDAAGKEITAKTEIKNNQLIIEIPQAYLDEAIYPISVDPSYTVKTGAATDSTGCNNGRKLARKSNGDLWAVYSRSDGSRYQIYTAYSTDNGETWTEEQVCSGTDSQYKPSIAIDSSDNIHVVWYGLGWGTNTTYDNIQYRERTTSWQTQEAVTDKNNSQFYPSIAIDSSDNIHVVWYGLGWGSNTGNYNIQYRERTTSWQTQEAVTDKNNSQYNPSIAIDSSDNIHVVWYGFGWGTNTTYYNIQYRERTTSWQTQEAVTDKNNYQFYPSIAIDSSDNIHVVWYGLGWGTNTTYYNIQYRERTTSWQTQEGLTDVAVNQQHPNLIWALHPTISGAQTNRPKTGYAFVWCDDTTVKFYKSSDLTWDTNVVAPTVTTQAASAVEQTTCTGNGNITDTGGANATRRGFCYMVGTSGDPTTANSVAYDDGSFGTGAYTKGITGLSAGTGYRVRAYAVNSAGTSYGDTVQVTTKQAYFKTCSEVVALDDTLDNKTSKALSEVIIISDTLANGVSKTCSEVIGIVDNLAVQKTLHRTYSETVSIVDSIANKTTKILSEIITIADSINIQKVFYKTLSEVVTIADTIIKKPTKVLSEVISVVDTLAIQKVLHRTLSEIITITDTVKKTEIKIFTETITVADTIKKSSAKVLSEVVTIVDTIAIQKTLLRTLSEVISITDTIAKKTAQVLSETITVVDGITKSTGKVLSEVITIVDTIKKTTTRVFAETITIVDGLTNKATKVLIEIVTIVDNISISKTFARTLSEVVSITDTIQKKTAKTLSEVIAIVDTVQNKATKVLTETITIVDGIVRATSKVLTETITLTESIYMKLNGINVKWARKYSEKTGTFIKKYWKDI